MAEVPGNCQEQLKNLDWEIAKKCGTSFDNLCLNKIILDFKKLQ